jgi:hypothetical protein
MLSNSNDLHKDEKRVDLLFSKFAAFYGHVWRSQFKDEVFLKFAKKQWHEGLMNFSEETVNKAIVGCREQFELPPTLPQMIGFCRDYEKGLRVYKAEHCIPAQKDIVDYYLAQCWEILKRTSKGESNVSVNPKN